MGPESVISIAERAILSILDARYSKTSPERGPELLLLRKYLCWIHLFSAFVCLRLTVRVLVSAGPFSRFIASPRSAVVVAGLGLFVAVFAAAWWTFFKDRRSARVWALAASSQFVFVNILPTLIAHHLRAGFPILLALGIVGFVLFARPLQARPAVAPVEEAFAIPGDFTSRHVNRISQGVTFGLSLGAYLWWQGWLRTEHITVLDGFLVRSVLTIIVLLAITSIHESGHAIVGMACGMKLRAFFIGPLQWRVRDEKWEFEFRPKGFLLADGVTALIPGNGQLRRRQYLSMMAAGSSFNMISGATALFAAIRFGHAIPLPVAGVIALFGAWSFGLAAANLLPFRTPQGYSDGAIVLQLLRGNAFADFHLSTAKIGSSLISALRPRDYDIGSIRRAARGIAHGRHALLLRLYAFSHSIDCGKTQEADDLLTQAELVCLQSAPNIPAELHTSFVFGNALIRRDPIAARFWWNRLQARKPTRFNADYWRAESALHWIEGNLEEARTAWKKSNDLAMQLPQVGAYDFSRYCCTLLRDELDQTAAAA
jgi:hypothetical protein